VSQVLSALSACQALSAKKLKSVKQTIERLLVKAKGQKEVTLAMIHHQAKLDDGKDKCSLKTLQRALHKEGVRFRRPREKSRPQILAALLASTASHHALCHAPGAPEMSEKV
jgi:hypothetical protein